MQTLASSPSASPVFVGRSRELTDLNVALERAIAGSGGIAIVMGEPGIGKSRLAAEVAKQAALYKASVFWSHCLESYDDSEFSPWIQIVRGCLRWFDSTGGELSHTRPAFNPAPQVAEFACKISTLGGRIGPELESGLYQALAGLLRNISESQPIVLILDDVHAADHLSLSLLPQLARDLRELRILLVMTCRDGELRRARDLADTLVTPSLRDMQRIKLRGLELSEIGELLREISGRIPAEDVVASISQMSAGNPLFVELLISNHFLTGWSNEPLPEELRASVEQHLAPISERTRRLLQRAAVVGREFHLPILFSACDLTTEDILDSLSEAALLGLIIESSDMPASYRFSHPLVRQTLYREIACANRVQLHGRIAESLEQLYADDSTRLASIASHFFAAAAVGKAPKAIAYCQRAAEHAASLLDFKESARLYKMALRASDLQKPADKKTRCELLLELGKVQQWDVGPSRQILKWATAIARRINDPDLIARAETNLAEQYQYRDFRSDAETIPDLPISPFVQPSPQLRRVTLTTSGDEHANCGANDASEPLYLQSNEGSKSSPLDTPSLVTVALHQSSTVAPQEYVFRKEGDYWTIVFEGEVARLKHLRGLAYIAHLLDHPRQEFHSLQLLGLVTGREDREGPAHYVKKHQSREYSTSESQATPVLDGTAKSAYKHRVLELREELEESKSFNDVGRIARIEEEIDFISRELLRAEGLGGRNRTWTSEGSRARVSVANAISTTLNKIRQEHAAAGRFFATTIKTGYFCSFVPDPRFPKPWSLR
jgi:hypothetical protein